MDSNDPHAKLYDGFSKCPTCRFYSSDEKVVAAHSLGCDGEVKWFCLSCRFDCQSRDELRVHYQSGDCVHEISKIIEPLYNMKWSVE